MADGKIEIIVDVNDSDAKKKLEGVEDAADETGKDLEDLGDSADEAGKGLDVVDVAAGNLVANGLSALISSLGNAIGELFALSEATIEYREDMAKLETAFTTTGHSTDTAQTAYKNFYKILGESDRSIEAANHLAELTKNEQEVAQWGTIAAGVTAKFGDSLPIEGLTEAANETAKVGKVTGPLADALNWAGISEDEFNKKLEKCNSEQERASLITSTLNNEYSAAAEEYNNLTASTQEARLATMEMEKTQAEVGATLEPITTAWTNLKTQALQAILPVIQFVADAFESLTQWMKENPEQAELLKGVILGLAVAFGILATALTISNLVNMLTKAFQALNLTMLANPVVLIVAAIAGLVVAFMYLWENCEGFREFWIGLWDGITTTCSNAWQSITEFFTSAWANIQTAWNTTGEFFNGIWTGIQNTFSSVGTWFSDLFSSAWLGIQNAWSSTGQFFSSIWVGIQNIFANVGSWFSSIFSSAWNGIQSAFSTWGNFFSGLWTNTQNAFANVGSWFSGVFSSAWTGIKSIFADWVSFFSGLWSSITRIFTDIGSKIGTAMGGAISGVVNGIIKIAEGIINSAISAINGAIDVINLIPNVNIGHVEKVSFPRLAKGGVLEKGQIGLLEGSGAEAVVPLEKNTGWLDKIAKRLSNKMSDVMSNVGTRVQATVNFENANYGNKVSRADTGFSELAQAVGIQTAGINSLSNAYTKGTGNTRPIILKVNERELGRTVVDTGNAETTRRGVKIATGGAY